jgi:AraC-like DNA-binding protein
MASLPVDVLWIARYDYDRGWTLRLHHHNYLQMILFLDGKGVFTLSGQELPIRSGQMFLIRAGETHGLRADTPVRTLDVKFRIEPCDLAQRLQRAPAVRHWNEPGLAARLERIRTEGEQKPPFYREVCSALLTELLYLYLRRDSRGLPAADPAESGGVLLHDSVLERASACIRARYHNALSVRAIAREAGCTDRTLRLHFRAAMRIRPLEFLQRFRIAKAKALIQYSDYSLKEIAEKVGFQTVHHFTRQFTAIVGRSPSAWRREQLEGIRKDVYINPEFENRIFTVQGNGREKKPGPKYSVEGTSLTPCRASEGNDSPEAQRV